jgi:hydrogenase nickel incorporation protein HypA/HybF
MVDDVARQYGGVAQSVVLRIGPLSGVEPSALRRAFPFAAAGTPAEGALLVIEDAEVVVRCRTCGATSHTTAVDLACRMCGDWQTDLISGDEMLLVRVELKQEADADV